MHCRQWTRNHKLGRRKLNDSEFFGIALIDGNVEKNKDADGRGVEVGANGSESAEMDSVLNVNEADENLA